MDRGTATERVFRQSWGDRIFVGAVLLGMLAIGLASAFLGGFRWPPLLFVAFVLGMAVLALWGHSCRLVITPSGIAQSHLFGRWRFYWSEVGAWRIVTDSDGDRFLYFRAGPAGKVYAVSGAAVDARELFEVERWFRQCCGEPHPEDSSLTPAWTEVPAPLRNGLRGLIRWAWDRKNIGPGR